MHASYVALCKTIGITLAETFNILILRNTVENKL